MQGLPISMLSILPSWLLSSWQCDTTEHTAGEMSSLALCTGRSHSGPAHLGSTNTRALAFLGSSLLWLENQPSLHSLLFPVAPPSLSPLGTGLPARLCSVAPLWPCFQIFLQTVHKLYPHSLPFLSKCPKLASSSHIVELRREACRYKTRIEETSMRWRCLASCVHPSKWSILVSVLPVVRGSPLRHSLFRPHPAFLPKQTTRHRSSSSFKSVPSTPVPPAIHHQ